MAASVEDILRAREKARRIKEHYDGTFGVPQRGLMNLGYVLSQNRDEVFEALESEPHYSKTQLPPPEPESVPERLRPVSARPSRDAAPNGGNHGGTGTPRPRSALTRCVHGSPSGSPAPGAQPGSPTTRYMWQEEEEEEHEGGPGGSTPQPPAHGSFLHWVGSGAGTPRAPHATATTAAATTSNRRPSDLTSVLEDLLLTHVNNPHTPRSVTPRGSTQGTPSSLLQTARGASPATASGYASPVQHPTMPNHAAAAAAVALAGGVHSHSNSHSSTPRGTCSPGARGSGTAPCSPRGSSTPHGELTIGGWAEGCGLKEERMVHGGEGQESCGRGAGAGAGGGGAGAADGVAGAHQEAGGLGGWPWGGVGHGGSYASAGSRGALEQEEEADGAGVVEDTGADEEGQGEWGAGAARAEADAEVEAERELRQRARQRLLSAGDLPPQEWARIGLPADAVEDQHFTARSYDVQVSWEAGRQVTRRIARPDIFHISEKEALRRLAEADAEVRARCQREVEAAAAEAEYANAALRQAYDGPRYDAYGVLQRPCSAAAAVRRSHSREQLAAWGIANGGGLSGGTSPVQARYLDWHPDGAEGMKSELRNQMAADAAVAATGRGGGRAGAGGGGGGGVRGLLISSGRGNRGGSPSAGSPVGGASPAGSRCASAVPGAVGAGRPSSGYGYVGGGGFGGGAGGDVGVVSGLRSKSESYAVHPGAPSRLHVDIPHDSHQHQHRQEYNRPWHAPSHCTTPSRPYSAYDASPRRTAHVVPPPRPDGMSDAHYAQLVRQQRKWLNAPAQPSSRPSTAHAAASGGHGRAVPPPPPSTWLYVRPRSSRPQPEGTAAPLPLRPEPPQPPSKPNPALATVIHPRTGPGPGPGPGAGAGAATGAGARATTRATTLRWSGTGDVSSPPGKGPSRPQSAMAGGRGAGQAGGAWGGGGQGAGTGAGAGTVGVERLPWEERPRSAASARGRVSRCASAVSDKVRVETLPPEGVGAGGGAGAGLGVGVGKVFKSRVYDVPDSLHMHSAMLGGYLSK